MSSMTFSSGPELGDLRATLESLRVKCTPIAVVVLAHLVLFYVAYSGMLTRMVDAALPKAVVVNFVAAAPQPKLPPSAPTVVQALPPPALPSVPVPVIQVALQPNSISVTQAQPPVERSPAMAVAAAVSAPAAAVAGPKTISTGIAYIQAPQPIYPNMSKRMGEQGKVVLRVLVNEKGLAESVSVQSSSGSARLDEAGRQAAQRALFKPYVEDGRAVPVYVIVPLNFELS